MTATRERRAQTILFVRALEEADRDCALLTRRERIDATRRAQAVTRAGETPSRRDLETVSRRAHTLTEQLLRRVPVMGDLLAVARFFYHLGPAIVLAAFLVGLATDALGSGRTIHLLSVPLLSLLGWNLLQYVLLGVGAVLRLRRGGVRGEMTRFAGSWVRVVTAVSMRTAIWRSRHVLGKSRRVPDGQIGALTEAMIRFRDLWMPAARKLLDARARRTLHLASVAMIAGVVAGMYLRGLVLDYRAVWESTLLDAQTVQRVLGVVLGPAAWLLDVSIPDVAPLRSAGGASGDAPASFGQAALWIHLYAATAFLVVGIPRLLLAGIAEYRSLRLARKIPIDLDDGYFRRIFSVWRGGRRRIRILPYSYAPARESIAHLLDELRESFGMRSTIEVLDPMPYGSIEGHEPSAIGEEPVSSAPTGTDDCLVVLFNLAQTPEVEVHAELLDTLKRTVETTGGQLLVVVDVEPFLRRGNSPDRRSERNRAWERVVREAGLVPVELDPADIAGDVASEAIPAAVWPRPDTVGAP